MFMSQGRTMMLVLIYQLSPTSPMSVIFEKVPIQGTYLQLLETEHNVGALGKCPIMCVGRFTPRCRAFDYEERNGGSCSLYEMGSSVVEASNHQVFMIPQKKDVFHTIRVEGQVFSILMPSTQASFFTSRDHCYKIGGYLIEIDSLKEYKAAVTLAKGENNGIFIGISDRHTEGVWLTERGRKPINLAVPPWNEFNHNARSSENCAVLTVDTWHVLGKVCWQEKHSLCERDL